MTELKNYKMFIGGEWLDADTHKTFETLNPETINLGQEHLKLAPVMWIRL